MLPAATLRGKVVDPTGAVLGDALVVLLSKDGRKFEARTGPDGTFQAYADIGEYDLHVSMPGFSEQELLHVKLKHGRQSLQHNLKVPVGTLGFMVVVTDPLQADTTDGKPSTRRVTK
ncbi:carboxypeptidase-like regulatory domain-containing protein [Granulicella cerasi]|nr:carboxypeptidase-like regulatory domain-containing protein [Granulicella cerasi]